MKVLHGEKQQRTDYGAIMYTGVSEDAIYVCMRYDSVTDKTDHAANS